MKKYCISPIEISIRDFDKIRLLLQVDFNDKSKLMTERIRMLGNRPSDLIYVFNWRFENDSLISLEIGSVNNNYQCNAVLKDLISKKEKHRFEPRFNIQKEMTFFDGEDEYVCLLKIVHNDF